MRRYLTKAAALLLSLVLGVIVLAGCVSKLPEDESVMAVFQGENISKTEVGLYIYTMQYDLEKGNEDTISSFFGSYETFWEQEEEDVSYATMCEQDAITALIQTRILNLKAASSGVKLSDEEEASLTEKIAAYKEEYAKAIEMAGADDALVEDFVRENAIANKMYLSIISEASEKINEEDFRRKEYEGIMIYGQYYDDDDEDKVDYTAEELAEKRDAAMTEIEALLKEGKTVQEVAELYIDDDIISVSSFTGSTVDPSYETKEEVTTHKQLAWMLSTGEVASIVTVNSAEKEVGYVLRCVDDDNAEEKAAAIEEELLERKEEHFKKVYGKLEAKYDNFVIREDWVEAYEFVAGLYESEYMTETEEETEE